jgi:DNA invertase Pin-like site-specific DNA recombinase
MTDAIYTRNSDPRQTEESQMNGMPDNLEKFHDDCQRTIPILNRDGLMQCLEHIGDSGIIYVSAFDRIGTWEHLMDLLRMLPEDVTVKTKAGLDIRENEMLTFCHGYIAKLEVKNKSQRQSNYAERTRAEGKLDCPRSYGFNDDRTVNAEEMRVLAVVKTGLENKMKKTDIVKLVKSKTGVTIARQRIYDWKNGKHFERIPSEYLDEMQEDESIPNGLEFLDNLIKNLGKKYAKNWPNGKHDFWNCWSNRYSAIGKGHLTMVSWLAGRCGIHVEGENYMLDRNGDYSETKPNWKADLYEIYEEILDEAGYDVTWGPMRVVKQ